VITKLCQSTKKGGLVISMVPNLYHLIYFNITIGNLQDINQTLKKKMGRFTKEMPEIHLFTPQSIADIYTSAGLKVKFLTGFPNVIYPSFSETQLKGQTQSIANLLANNIQYDLLLKLEQQLTTNKDIAARGNNIFIVGEKQ
jgi:hypothetical protein